MEKQIHRNYKYKRLSKSESDDEVGSDRRESLELLNRCPKKTSPEKLDASCKGVEYDTIFEKPIQQGESLASISLKYRISVSDLKRLNKLHKDAEFYALSTLKIPVKLNSVLYEVLQEECLNQDATSESRIALGQRISSISSNSEIDSEVDMPVGLISISQICREKDTRREARHFLMNMQKDLQKLQAKTNSYKGSLDEAADTLNSVAFIPMDEKTLGLGCSGADWGLSWWKVLTVGGVIIVGVPFLYLILFS